MWGQKHYILEDLVVGSGCNYLGYVVVIELTRLVDCQKINLQIF